LKRWLSPQVALVLLVGALGLAILGGLSFGAIRLGLREWLGILSYAQGAEAVPGGLVFWQLRLPRVLLAVLVGATLSVAGAMMQGLFRNPLADPGLVGVSSGAALGAVIVIVLGEHLGFLRFFSGPWLVPVAALVGAWLVTWIILQMGSLRGAAAVATLLLAGIAINAFVGAVIGICTFLATDAQLRSLNFWMLGSLGGASWQVLAVTLPFCLVLLLAAPRMAHALNALSLGEAEAGHLGFQPERLKRTIILLTAVGVGGCVAQTGMIGFVGLVVPHLFRLAVGPDHRWLIPGCALLGAALLVVADTASRTLVAPAEMPIGIVTAVVGAPFFLWLLWQQKRRISWL
jgi:iron complex transport system permease protein